MAGQDCIVPVSGTTRIVALVGHPVSHTKSPRMQNAAFRAAGMDFCYVAFDVLPEHLADAVAGMRALKLLGANVTIPHKEAIPALLDEVDPEAAFIGAVNTIVNRDGRLCGYNTDGRGFMHSLKEAGIETGGRRVLMLGAGGAARAVGYYLAQQASQLVIANRTPERAERLAADLLEVGADVRGMSMADAQQGELVGSMDVIVNATSAGLNPSDPSPINAALIHERHAVCDLIYHETPLILGARRAGARTLSGQGMLLWQGVLAFELWTGMAAPVETMREALQQ